jgi:hypothetical protein
MTRQALITLAACALIVMVAGALQAEPTYVGAEKCKMCHKVEYASWAETSHAKATDTAKAATDREYTADCLKCHATNADENLPGVQCEACHGAGSDFKKMSIMKDHEQAVAAGLLEVSQATCDGCHVGDDHASAVVFEEQKGNTAAIHEKKAE